MYINNVLYCFYSSDIEALEACFRLLHDDDDDDDVLLLTDVVCWQRSSNSHKGIIFIIAVIPIVRHFSMHAAYRINYSLQRQ